MAEDYIPSNDGEFIEFAENYIEQIDGNEENLGLTAGTTAGLTSTLTVFKSSYSQNNDTYTNYRASTEKKDDDRKPIEAKIREATRIIQVAPGVTDAQRAALRITVRQTSTTPTGPPTSRPVLEIDTSEPLRHTVKFYDNALETKGKPPGVRGVEIWCKIGGEATMDEEEYRYLGTDTASPYLAVHRPEDVGKQAHYIARWVNSRGEYGAWSNPETATITG